LGKKKVGFQSRVDGFICAARAETDLSKSRKKTAISTFSKVGLSFPDAVAQQHASGGYRRSDRRRPAPSPTAQPAAARRSASRARPPSHGPRPEMMPTPSSTSRPALLALLLAGASSAANVFAGLPALPLPHMNGFSGGVPPETMSLDNAEWLDLVRVTGTVFLSGISDPTRADDPLRTTPEDVATAVNAAARFNASLGVSYAPWVDFLPNFTLGPAFWPPPTDESFEPAVLGYFAENMARIVQWVADANAALGTCVAVRWVAFDQEVMCMGDHPEWADAVTRKNNLFYRAAKAALPGASVQWYGRGDEQFWNWCQCWAPNTCFTMREQGDGTLGTEMYMLYNLSLSNATYFRAAATAAAAAEPHVTPYFSFGAGWAIDDTGARQWTWNISADPSTTFEVGTWLAPPAAAPWSDAAVVGIYPHVLDARLAPVYNPTVGATTTGRLHFVAYAMGVAKITTFPTTPVMNVTAAPVLRCPNPPPAPPAPPPPARPQYSQEPLVLAVASPIALALALGGGAGL